MTTINDLKTMSVEEKIALMANLAKLPNAAELGVNLSQDTSDSVRSGLARNLAGLPNAAELAVKLSQDDNRYVRTAMGANLNGLPNANWLALNLYKDPEEAVRRIIDTRLIEKLAVTFHLPIENKGLTGHEANVSVTLNQSDFNWFDYLKKSTEEMGINAFKIDSLNKLKVGNDVLSIELTPITFENNPKSTVYNRSLEFSNDSNSTGIKIIYDSDEGLFETEEGITLEGIEASYLHAIKEGASHVIIPYGFEAQFTNDKPEILSDLHLTDTACRTGFDAVCESLNIHPNKKITDNPKVKDLKFD